MDQTRGMNGTEVKAIPKPALSPLEEAERRFKGFTLASLNTTDLLLLDIARSLREANKKADDGLAWSKGLAKLLEPVDEHKGGHMPAPTWPPKDDE